MYENNEMIQKDNFVAVQQGTCMQSFTLIPVKLFCEFALLAHRSLGHTHSFFALEDVATERDLSDKMLTQTQ